MYTVLKLANLHQFAKTVHILMSVELHKEYKDLKQ